VCQHAHEVLIEGLRKGRQFFVESYFTHADASPPRELCMLEQAHRNKGDGPARAPMNLESDKIGEKWPGL